MERAYRIRPCTIIDFRGAKPPLGRLFLGGLFHLAGLFAPICFYEADGGEFQEGETAAVEIFPVLGETAAAVEPSDRTLDDPTLG